MGKTILWIITIILKNIESFYWNLENIFNIVTVYLELSVYSIFGVLRMDNSDLEKHNDMKISNNLILAGNY